MRTISKLFGKSPFTPLQAHMRNVAECINKTKELFGLMEKGDYDGVFELAKIISKLEHNADLTKNDIRNNLPKGLFMAVDKGSILEILGIQDNIADKAEDIGILLTFRNLTMPPELKEPFNAFLEKNFQAFDVAFNIVDQLDELLDYTFTGMEALKVNEMVDDVALKEHEADILQRKLLQKLYNLDNEIPYQDFVMILQLIQECSAISNYSEKLGHRIRIMLDLK